MMLWVIFGVFFIFSLIAAGMLKSRFRKYSKIPSANGMSGFEVAKKMLADHGIFDVAITSVQGKLTDHYNPLTRSVNLSPEVYNGRNIAAAAVAAHEVGHAVQHAQGYAWLKMRTALVPIQNVSATVMNVIFIGMIFGSFLLGNILSMEKALMIIIACYSVFTVFAFITLPVEFNATAKGLAWLTDKGITTYESHGKAQSALRWAASTYVIAAISSLATLLYYVALLAGSRD